MTCMCHLGCNELTLILWFVSRFESDNNIPSRMYLICYESIYVLNIVNTHIIILFL